MRGARRLGERAAKPRACYELDVEDGSVKHEYHASYPLPLSDRCQRRRVGAGRPLFDLARRGCPAAALPVARGLQRAALARAGGRALAPAADQLPALADRLPTDPPLARG